MIGTLGRVRASLVVATVLVLALLFLSYLLLPAHDSSPRAEGFDPASSNARAPAAVQVSPAPSERASVAAASDPVVQAARSRSTLRVLTIDGNDEPVGRVSLHLRDDRASKPVGVTDESGEGTVAPPEDAWSELIAVREGYAAACVVLRSPAPTRVVLRMLPATTLEGTVVYTDGSPAEAEVLVLALPRGRALSVFDKPERIWSEPEVIATQTNADGRFVLRGLDPSLRYEVIAGGRGLVQDAPVEDLRLGSVDVKVVVLRGYAARIEMRDPDGAKPRMDRVFGSGIGATAALAEPEARFVRHAKLFALLSGAGLEPVSDDPWDLVYVAGAPGLLAEVQLELHAQPPGYAVVTTRVPLRPLSEGIQPIRVTLEPIASGFGTLVLERAGGTSSVVADTRIGPFAVLTLFPTHGLPWHYPLFDSRLGRRHLDHVPFGRYRVVFEVFASQALVPTPGEYERFIEIGPEPTVLRYDGAALGAIEVRAHDANGASYEGELVIFFGPGAHESKGPDGPGSFRGEYLSFRRAPYVIDHLPATPHTVYIESSRFDEGWYPVDVEAGHARPVDIAFKR